RGRSRRRGPGNDRAGAMPGARAHRYRGIAQAIRASLSGTLRTLNLPVAGLERVGPQQARISEWLVYDACHAQEAWQSPGWEVHPIAQIEVCSWWELQ